LGLHRIANSFNLINNQNFILDLFSYGKNIFGLTTNPAPGFLTLSNNAFIQNDETEIIRKKFYLRPKNTFYSCLNYNGDVILGDFFHKSNPYYLAKINRNSSVSCSKEKYRSKADGTAWDIAAFNNKIYVAVGSTSDNNSGFLYITDSSFTSSPVISNTYLTCLALDSINNVLYTGSINKGVQILKGIIGTHSIDYPGEINFKVNNGNYLFYSKYNLQVNDLSLTEKIKVNNGTTDELKNINAADLFGDTLITSDRNYFYLYNTKTGLLVDKFKNPDGGSYTSSIVFNGNIYSFVIYGNLIKHDLTTKKCTSFVSYQNFLPYPKVAGDKIVVLNKEKGFGIVTEKDAFNLSCSDNNIAFITDFAAINDTIYGLTNHSVQQYGIDYKNRSLKLYKNYPIDSCIQGFIPEWIFNYHNKLYIANKQGILRINRNNGQPLFYYYLGNYNLLNEPKVVGDSLVWVAGGFITKVAISEIDQNEFALNINSLAIQFPENINEQIAFKVAVNCPEYLLQEHSLKILTLWKDGKQIAVRYTIGNGFEFGNGLTYGSYELVLIIGNNTIKRTIDIGLPLNRNPYFFGTILFFVLVIMGVIIKMQLDKRTLNKKLLQNRLHILKQNLNPHFVYNSMNLISSLILEGKYNEAVQVTADFSNLQRTYLETNNKDVITLQEELDFLKAYLKLQHTRFYLDKNFSYSMEVSPEVDADAIVLPPLVLQPLAENAIKYGVIASGAAEKKINITVKGIAPNKTIISIEDNGIPIPYTKQGQGLGHHLVTERIQLFANYHKKSIALYLNKPPLFSLQGYRVEIHIG